MVQSTLNWESEYLNSSHIISLDFRCFLVSERIILNDLQDFFLVQIFFDPKWEDESHNTSEE